MKQLNPIMISGKEVLPLIEGGKGINGSDGRSSGSWAKENCVGTFSGVSPDFYDSKGNVIIETFHKKNRAERHEEMIEYAIRGGVAQAQVAHEVSNGNGRIHINMLWELIVSSARAFQVLWKRAYSNFREFLGGVVYEDPWLAGGHNGLSNAEDPTKPQAPYERLVELRRLLRSLGLDNIPIILAGGVWSLKDWQDYIDNPDIGKIAFQFGTRPMITKESPVSEAWKKVMLQVKKGDVILQKFSPTGFFSSAIKNTFLEKLIQRKQGEVAFSKEQTSEFSHPLSIRENKTVYIKPEDASKAEQQLSAGYTEIQETPDNTVVFLTPAEWKQMKQDRAECVGCLSQCQFSTWSRANGTTGKLPDPRSYCIHKTLYEVGHNGSIKDNLLFAGHQVYRFATDPLYRNGIPTVKELIEKIKSGE